MITHGHRTWFFGWDEWYAQQDTSFKECQKIFSSSLLGQVVVFFEIGSTQCYHASGRWMDFFFYDQLTWTNHSHRQKNLRHISNTQKNKRKYVWINERRTWRHSTKRSWNDQGTIEYRLAMCIDYLRHFYNTWKLSFTILIIFTTCKKYLILKFLRTRENIRKCSKFSHHCENIRKFSIFSRPCENIRKSSIFSRRRKRVWIPEWIDGIFPRPCENISHST